MSIRSRGQLSQAKIKLRNFANKLAINNLCLLVFLMACQSFAYGQEASKDQSPNSNEELTEDEPLEPVAWSIADFKSMKRVLQTCVSKDGSEFAYIVASAMGASVQSDLAEDCRHRQVSTQLIYLDKEGNSKLLVEAHNISALKWRPASSELCYTIKNSAACEVHSYDLKLKKSTKLFSAPASSLSYQWDKSGKLAAVLLGESYLKQQNQQSKVFLYQGDGLQAVFSKLPQSLKCTPGQQLKEIALSEDASRLALLKENGARKGDQLSSQILVYELSSKEEWLDFKVPAQCRSLSFSPSGARLLFLRGVDNKDSAQGHLYGLAIANSRLWEVLPSLRGDILQYQWADEIAIVYLAHKGVQATIGHCSIFGEKDWNNLFLPGRIVPESFDLSEDLSTLSLCASHASHPAELYKLEVYGNEEERLTSSNLFLVNRGFAKQERIRFYARDNLRIEGIYLTSKDSSEGANSPSLVVVLPSSDELHQLEYFTNSWLSNWLEPGQLAVQAGMDVLYLNPRGSGGRGAAFSKAGQGGQLGSELEDVLDAIGYLRSRSAKAYTNVALVGGGRGGYLSTLAASKHASTFKACVSIAGWTDLSTLFYSVAQPYAWLSASMGRSPQEIPALYQELSPFHILADRSSCLLLLHGRMDKVVPFSQSQMLFNRMKAKKLDGRLIDFPAGHRLERSNAASHCQDVLIDFLKKKLSTPNGASK